MWILEGIDFVVLLLVDLVEVGELVVLCGIVSGWLLVQVGLGGVQDVMVYLCSVDVGVFIQYLFGGFEIGGCLFYSVDFIWLNFEVWCGVLVQVLEEIVMMLYVL